MASNRKQVFLIIFVIIVVLNFIDGVWQALHGASWDAVVGQLILMAVVGYVAWRSRETFQQAREQYRRRFEEGQDNLSVKDAALFSLSWSKEIYRSIPDDRKGLVKQAFVLIGIGMAVVLVNIGLDNLLTLLVIAALILAGVNLLIWVFSTERGERERLRIELDTARQMQLNLMPASDPSLPGFDIAGCCVPAQDVGGDSFDYVRLGGGDGPFGIAVVDVAGKGMDAAMTAVFTSGAFVSEVQHERDPALVLGKLNSAVRSRHDRTRFVSFLLLALDPDGSAARFVNAGQSKPLLVRGGTVTMLESDGAHFPLGLVESVSYGTQCVPLQPGDMLVLYTDGLTEAMNPAREMYGEERLCAALASCAGNGLGAKAIIDTLRAAVRLHAGAAEQHDDLTIVVVRALPAV
jgi:sigma-B regulation protein RsbU (phosphoserine phosphatase)